MTTTTTDLHEIVTDLVHTGRSWCGALPPVFGDATTRRRIKGAAFNFLVMIEGNGRPGRVRLSPKDNLDVDLGGEVLHELLGIEAQYADAEQRRLLAAARRAHRRSRRHLRRRK